MKKNKVLFLLVALVTWIETPSWAQAGSGWYLSGDLGANFASGLDITASSNDRASVCDEYINPYYDEVEDNPRLDPSGDPYRDYNCTGPNRGETGNWQNQLDRATGVLAGAAVGYSFAGQNQKSPLGGFRMELEYFYRQSNYDQTSDIPGASGESGDKLAQEIVLATDRIGSMTSHNLFGNLLYDFDNASRFTPYIGVGGGIGVTDMEYGSVWARNHDPNKITTGLNLDHQHMIRQNLAGTVSVAQTTLSDTLYGLQVLFGVDYAVTETMSLGLKGRWVRFSVFEEKSGVVWDPLRGHPPNLRLDGSEPVSGELKTDDIEFVGVSVNLKYHF